MLDKARKKMKQLGGNRDSSIKYGNDILNLLDSPMTKRRVRRLSEREKPRKLKNQLHIHQLTTHFFNQHCKFFL